MRFMSTPGSPPEPPTEWEPSHSSGPGNGVLVLSWKLELSNLSHSIFLLPDFNGLFKKLASGG